MDKTYTIANCGSTILARLEGVDKGNDNTGARVANGMTETDGTTENNISSSCHNAKNE